MKRGLTILVLLILSIVMVWADCGSAIEVSAGKECLYTEYTLTSGAGKLAESDCGWTTRNYKEVWFKTRIPVSGRMMVATEADYVDGFISVYRGDCSELKTFVCSNNGHLPEALDITDIPAGEEIYVRIAMIHQTNVSVCFYELEKLERPDCLLSAISADLCSEATLINSPEGYCGNTSSSYTAEKPGNLQNVFCGSIENNSWLQFVASKEKANLNIFVSNCRLGVGLQMRVFETDDCLVFTPTSNCWNPEMETNGIITATGLKPGKRYYLMIDGHAGDVCDYTISAGDGVETPQNYIEDIICNGKRYQKYGFDVDKPGTYRRTETSASGNDSLIILTLTGVDKINTYLYGQIYSCERYQEHGFDVNAPGKHYQYLTSESGCDSIVELDLQVDAQKEYDIYGSICAGAIYSYHGFYESKAGDYVRKLKTAQGCDSIVTLHLTVDGFDLDVTGVKDICSGDVTTLFASGGVKYTWKDADGNEIGRGDSIRLSPEVTTKYKLYSTLATSCPETVTDCSKAHNVYPVVKIGNHCWMAENLKSNIYDTESERPGVTLNQMPSESTPVANPLYYNTSRIDYKKMEGAKNLTAEQQKKLGYLYTWTAAVGLESEEAAYAQVTGFPGDRQGICPNGWHLPDSLEIKEMVETLGGEQYAGKKLRTTTGWYDGTGYVQGTDEYKFSLLPAAYAKGGGPWYTGYNGSIWSADPWPYQQQDPDYNKKAVDLCTFFDSEGVTDKNRGVDENPNEKYIARAVRCVITLE